MSEVERLLDVADLNVTFPSPTGAVQAVRSVSFTLARERLAIVGESGSGKSTLGHALLRLVPAPGVVRARRMWLAGHDLLALDEHALRRVRGARIAMIMQDPKYSLNPVMRVGEQIAEAYRLHNAAGRRVARARAREMLETVRIRDPERVFHAYPHERSGGMGQCVMTP
ncbi:MAG: ATP-binding cassette domain-containing protein [Gammaproteobacteria bacterium]